MKKLILLLVVVSLPLLITGSAWATPFTMSATQLQALYETGENPDSASTYLNPVQPLPTGAKYKGDILNCEGWGEIWIGANSSGIPYGGSSKTNLTTAELGMEDLSAYDSYELVFMNTNENPWEFNLYVSDGSVTATSGWMSIAKGETAAITLNLTGWGLNLTNITDIGFGIGAELPVDSDDYTYEAKVYPTPEPTSLVLLGTGLLGLAAFARKKRNR